MSINPKQICTMIDRERKSRGMSCGVYHESSVMLKSLIRLETFPVWKHGRRTRLSKQPSIRNRTTFLDDTVREALFEGSCWLVKRKVWSPAGCCLFPCFCLSVHNAASHPRQPRAFQTHQRMQERTHTTLRNSHPITPIGRNTKAISAHTVREVSMQSTTSILVSPSAEESEVRTGRGEGVCGQSLDSVNDSGCFLCCRIGHKDPARWTRLSNQTVINPMQRSGVIAPFGTLFRSRFPSTTHPLPFLP